MLPQIWNRIPRGTKSHCTIRCTAWRKSIKGNIVFLAKLKKLVFMPVRMEFNLFRKNFNEENM
jgi:hypothetical protein